MNKDFSLRLRKALEDKNITATELSRLSGVGKSDISYYLKGSYVPKQDKCYMLAKALNVDPGWLMTGVEPKPLIPAMPTLKENPDHPDTQTVSELMEALHQNPKLGVLFDRQLRMSEDDIDIMLQITNRILKENYGD